MTYGNKEIFVFGGQSRQIIIICENFIVHNFIVQPRRHINNACDRELSFTLDGINNGNAMTSATKKHDFFFMHSYLIPGMLILLQMYDYFHYQSVFCWLVAYVRC